MTQATTDDDIIRQALEGRPNAHALLVRRYERFVFTLCLRFVKNREDAHEIASDTFLRAFRYLPDFRGECKFSTWLYKIAYSTSLNHLRKKSPEIRSLDDELNPVQLPDTTAPDAAFALETGDRNAGLREAIEQLLPDDATIITLFYLYEQSLEEICQIMDLTNTNAKTKLCRARQRLRTVIESKFSDLVRS